MSRLIVISNRVNVPKKEDKGSSGGLAKALHAALQEYKGIWFGWSGEVVEDAAAKISIEMENGVTVATMDLSKEDYEEYYNGFANRTLWPLLHYRMDLTAYDRSFDTGYFRVNENFAKAVRPLIEPDDLIWVHDYHLFPCAAALREHGVKNRIGFFLHIPWPSHQVLITLPKHRALVESLFAYDLIGFQTKDSLQAFEDYVVREVGGKVLPGGRIEAFGKSLQASVFPIGIDSSVFIEMPASPEGRESFQRMRESLRGRKLIIGVDRIDYSKGLEQRFSAYETLLETHPEIRGRVLLMQIAPPSRSEVLEYQMIREQLESLSGRINGRFADIDWVPLRYVNSGHSRPALAGLYRASRVSFVTPLRDGMNLVAKEFIAAQDPEDPGVLVLSRFAGAAYQMKEALIVNPYDIAAMSEALYEALNMSKDERIRRWEAMYHTVMTEDVSAWRDNFVSALQAQPIKAAS